MKTPIVIFGLIALLGFGLQGLRHEEASGGTTEVVLRDSEVDWEAIASGLKKRVPSSHFQVVSPAEFELVDLETYRFDPNAQLHYFAQSNSGNLSLAIWTLPDKPRRVYIGRHFKRSYWAWDDPAESFWANSRMEEELRLFLTDELKKQNAL